MSLKKSIRWCKQYSCELDIAWGEHIILCLKIISPWYKFDYFLIYRITLQPTHLLLPIYL